MGLGVVLFVVAAGCGARRTVVPGEADADSDADVDADVDTDVDADSDSYADPCDLDGDHHSASRCGGDDCDDGDPAIHPGARDDAWHVEVVNDEYDGSRSSLAVDGSGTLHVTWYTGSSLRYATNASGAWETERVTDAASGGGALAVEPDGTGVITFGWGLEGKITTNAGGTWRIWNFDFEDAGGESSVALDADGIAHAAYLTSERALRHLSFADRVAETEPIVDDAQGWTCSIAVDSTGRLHVASAGEGLWYDTNASGAWVGEAVHNANDAEVALDPEDGVHIALSWNEGLVYASRALGGWSFDDIDTAGSGHIDLAIDAAGAAHVAWSASSDDMDAGVFYSTNQGGAWTTSFVGSAGDDSASIVAMPDGTPHVTYFAITRTGLELRHAWPAEPDGIDQDCDGRDGR